MHIRGDLGLWSPRLAGCKTVKNYTFFVKISCKKCKNLLVYFSGVIMAKYRVVEVVSDTTHLTEEKISSVLGSYKSVERWAWILHDKDLKDDGTPKNPHYHVVMQLKAGLELGAVGKWFGVADNFVEGKKGAGAFLDCVKYETHEDFPEKAQYEDSAVHANFDFRAELTERELSKAKYGGRELTVFERFCFDVKNLGRRVESILKTPDGLYLNARQIKELRYLRGVYLQTAEMPKLRLNYYVCGGSGLGKSIASRAFARYFARKIDDSLQTDEEKYFVVGTRNNLFDGYDGQPVIIWEDMKSYDIVQSLGGVGEFLKVFDPLPSDRNQNVKYGSVRLVNHFNIINSTESMETFERNIISCFPAGDDENQTYRRFPIFSELKSEQINTYVRAGFLDDSESLRTWAELPKVYGSFAKVQSIINQKMKTEIEDKMATAVLDDSIQLLESRKVDSESDVIPNQFLAYGEKSNEHDEIPF